MDARNSDHLRLKGLCFWGRHGHLPSEKELGNRFEVDVDLEVDFSRAAEMDQLDLTVDLAEVYEIVRQRVEGEPCHLIETLAQKIALDLVKLPRVNSARIRVCKLFPPLFGAVQGTMEVEVTRCAEVNSDDP